MISRTTCVKNCPFPCSSVEDVCFQGRSLQLATQARRHAGQVAWKMHIFSRGDRPPPGHPVKAEVIKRVTARPASFDELLIASGNRGFKRLSVHSTSLPDVSKRVKRVNEYINPLRHQDEQPRAPFLYLATPSRTLSGPHSGGRRLYARQDLRTSVCRPDQQECRPPRRPSESPAAVSLFKSTVGQRPWRKHDVDNGVQGDLLCFG